MIYFDNAATTWKKPDSVYDAVIDIMKNYSANPGRGSHKASREALKKVMICRDALSKFLNVNSFNICFTKNATESLNIVINGYLDKKDHVIISALEHNSVLRPIVSRNIEYSVLGIDEEGFINPYEIEKLINNKTKLLILTHASNVLGTIQDIDKVSEICKKNNIKVMIDVAQTLGCVDLDGSKFDFIAGTGHKGLYGIQGIGFLYTKHNISELIQGGTGSNSESLLQPQILPDKFESGTLNLPGIASIKAGIEFINKTETRAIRKHEQELIKFFFEQVSDIKEIKVYGTRDISKKTGLISFNIDGYTSNEVSTILDYKYDIYTRSGLHCSALAHKAMNSMDTGTVRISFSYFNTIDEVAELILALKDIINSE